MTAATERGVRVGYPRPDTGLHAVADAITGLWEVNGFPDQAPTITLTAASRQAILDLAATLPDGDLTEATTTDGELLTRLAVGFGALRGEPYSSPAYRFDAVVELLFVTPAKAVA